MKILYTYETEQEKSYIAEKLSMHDVVFHAGSLQDNPPTGGWSGEDIECLCIFVNSTIGNAECEQFPDLKYIATRSTGFDHIDMKCAHERSIVVSSVPSYGEHTVAEYAFALLLTLSRNMSAASKRVQEGSFSSEGLSGFDLYGKTIGVLGTGKIGKNVIKIARGFGMTVTAFDLYPDQGFAKENNFAYTSLEEVISHADIISLHLPQTTDTEHIIDKVMISKMKKGSIIINTARGSLIDTAALVWGLKEGIIAGAGLDVLDEEGYVADEMKLLSHDSPDPDELKTLLLNHYLIDHPHVVITPHNAFNTREALQRILDVTVENIQRFTSGSFLNVVK